MIKHTLGEWVMDKINDSIININYRNIYKSGNIGVIDGMRGEQNEANARGVIMKKGIKKKNKKRNLLLDIYYLLERFENRKKKKEKSIDGILREYGKLAIHNKGIFPANTKFVKSAFYTEILRDAPKDKSLVGCLWNKLNGIWREHIKKVLK